MTTTGTTVLAPQVKPLYGGKAGAPKKSPPPTKKARAGKGAVKKS